MKKKRSLAILAALVVIGAVWAQEKAAEPDDSAKDLKALQGTWKPIKATRGGKTMDKDLDKVKFTFEKGNLTIDEGGPKTEKATFTLDAKKSPKQIDLVPPEKADSKVTGIYKLDKDELTLCFGKPGGTRPTKFDDKETMVLVLKRQK